MAAFARSRDFSPPIETARAHHAARRRDGSMAARGKGIGCKLYPLCASSDHHESAVAIVAGKSDARVIPIKQAKTLTFENISTGMSAGLVLAQNSIDIVAGAPE